MTTSTTFKSYKTKAAAASVAKRQDKEARPSVDGSVWYVATAAEWAAYDDSLKAAQEKPAKSAKGRLASGGAWVAKSVEYIKSICPVITNVVTRVTGTKVIITVDGVEVFWVYKQDRANAIVKALVAND